MILVFRGSSNALKQEFHYLNNFVWITAASISTNAKARLNQIWFEFFEG